MKFKYQAKTSEGKIQKGIVEAVSQSSAMNVLRQNGLEVVELEQEKEIPILSSVTKALGGVKTKEFVLFSRQLAVLIEAKVPLIKSLHSIARQTENKFFALKLYSIVVDIDSGSSFSEALSRHPDTFSKFYVSMVRAGESAGRLQETLNDIADNIEKNYEITSNLKGALYYPAFIMLAMVGVGFVVTVFVLPKLLGILEEANVELPLQTRLLIAVTGFLSSYWWAVLLGMIGSVVGFFYYIKTEGGKRELDYISLKIPKLNEMLMNVYISRFAENLSKLIQSGLPITSALAITGDIVGNAVYRDIILQSSEELKRGGSISDVLGKHPEFPPVIVQMISVGENTGRVDYTLKKVAEFYSKENERMTKTFSSLVEPILMIVLAIGVGIMVSAVLLPIYQVATSMQ